MTTIDDTMITFRLKLQEVDTIIAECNKALNETRNDINKCRTDLNEINKDIQIMKQELLNKHNVIMEA